ncbi:uncharacterized protein CC84DRAFT_1205293 [Paraphaeosphaeria sporulosa]|uniref:Uncharacterized protein n=1 Tax=Paraphaeosphaeria sporulosa TaxID=1460663 RepID=A0A177CFB1_9PLEO|nr:uncharacterized protein CC84DRAFT_1205293 [Paraphaeosphaeria sporulosa]OAG05509.1 hypothetical protein CC84DRAFT_1205293 [Paraphaeosphaeria sporulosa]
MGYEILGALCPLCLPASWAPKQQSAPRLRNGHRVRSVGARAVTFTWDARCQARRWSFLLREVGMSDLSLSGYTGYPVSTCSLTSGKNVITDHTPGMLVSRASSLAKGGNPPHAATQNHSPPDQR